MLKRVIVYIFIICWLPAGLFGQEFNWAKHVANSSSNSNKSITTLANSILDTTLVGANFGGTITIGGNAITAVGGKDNLLHCISPDSSIFWTNAVHFESTGDEDQIFGSVYDSTSGTFNICGKMEGKTTVKIGTNLVDSMKYSKTNYFVANFSKAIGTQNWVYPDSGTTTSEANAIVSDRKGNLYIAGRFHDSLEVDTTLFGSSTGDLFLLKLQISTGNLLWARSIKGLGKEEVTSMVYDAASSRVVVLGNFEDSLFLGSNSIAPLTKGRKDVFAARFDAGGGAISLKRVFGSTADIEVLDADIIDAGGSYVVSGRFNGSISGTSIITNGGYDILIARVSSNDVALVTKAYGGNSNEEGNEIEINASSVSFVHATYESSVFSFGSSSITKKGVRDVCLLASQVNLTPIGGKGSGLMSLPTDQIFATAMSHSQGKLVIGNSFRGLVKYGTKGTFTSPAGTFDMAFAQIIPSKIYCNTNDTLQYAGFRSVVPNQHLCAQSPGEITSLADTSFNFSWYKLGSPTRIDTVNKISVVDSAVYFVEVIEMSGGAAICVDTFFTDTVKVDLLPAVSIVGDTTCNNILTGFPLRTTPAFQNSTTDSLYGRGIANNLQNLYNPGTPGVGIGLDTVIYQRVDMTTNCIGRDSAIVTIHAKPSISISGVKIYCQGDPADTLKFGSSVRTLKEYYSMTVPAWGVKDSQVFRCDSLIAATHDVLYSVIDSNNCSNDTLVDVVIKPSPNVNLNLNQSSVCKNAPIFNLSGQSIAGGSFYGVGVLDTVGRYDPDSSSYGMDTIKYVFEARNGCADTATDILTIDTIPKITFVFSDTICASDKIYILKATPEVGAGDSALFYGHSTAVSGSNFFPQFSGTGFFPIWYKFKDSNGCTDSASTTVEVKNLPSVSHPNLGGMCENRGDTLLDQGKPVGGKYFYKQYLLTNDILKPDTSYINYGTDTIYYQYTDSFKCQNTAFNFVNIKQKPSISINQSFFDNLCDNSDSIDLNVLDISKVDPPPANGGFFSYDSVTKIDFFNPITYSAIPIINRPALAYNYFHALSGCSNTVGIFPDIKKSPIVSITHAGSACAGLDYLLTAQGALEWKWSTGDSTTSVFVVQDTTTTYTVTGRLGICFDSVSTTVDITPGELITAKDDSIAMKKGSNVTLDPLKRLYSQDTLKLIGAFNVYEGPKEARSFDTTGGVAPPGVNSNIYYEPNIEFRRTDSVLYQVCNISCANICDSAKVIFYVLGNPYEFIPSAYTPNGDGVNDFWVIPGIEAYAENEVYIYNRWGDLVYQAAPYENTWEGQTNKGIAGGKKLGDGTYFYVLKTNGGDPIKGTVELKTK